MDEEAGRGDAGAGRDVRTAQEPAPVVAALLALGRRRWGTDVALAEPSTSITEGFDSEIHLVRLTGPGLPAAWQQPLVLRVKADADRLEEAQQEAEVQGWLADAGFPAPRVLAVHPPGELGPGAVQVMERAPGRMLLDALKARPWTARRSIGRLAEVHARLHALPADGFPSTDDLLDRRLRLTRHVAAALDDGALGRGLVRIEALADRLRDAAPSVCHGDFHPLNVLVDGDRLSVIDWTDAGLGDRHGDVARTLLLFELAAIAGGNQVERAALRVLGPLLGRRYRRGYERHAPLDPRRLALWTPVHLLHGWSQARALHAGLFERAAGAHDDRVERVPPALVVELERRFDAAVAAVDA